MGTTGRSEPRHITEPSTPRARGHDEAEATAFFGTVQHPPRTWARPERPVPAPPAHVGTTSWASRRRAATPSTPRTRGHDGGNRPTCSRGAQHPPYTWARHQPVVVDQSLYPRGRGNRFGPLLPTMSEDLRSLSECRSSCASGCLRTFFQHAICTFNGQSRGPAPPAHVSTTIHKCPIGLGRPSTPAHVSTTAYKGPIGLGHPSTPRARGHDAQADFSHEWPVQHPPRTWARPFPLSRIEAEFPAPPAHVGTTPASSRRPVVVPTW